MGTTPTSRWQPLHDTFYRLTPTYSLDDSPLSLLDLSHHRLAHSTHAGPVALTRDTSKPVPLDSHYSRTRLASNRVSVYSLQGHLVQHISWDPPSPIVHLSLPTPTSLLLLTASGLYRLYALSSHPSLAPSFSQHALPRTDDLGGVADAKPYPGGVVVRFKDGAFCDLRGVGARSLVDNAVATEGRDAGRGKRRGDREGQENTAPGAGAGGGKPVFLAATGIEHDIDCWAVVPAEASAGRHVEVLVGAGETVYRLDEIECVDQRLTRGPYLSIVPSPSGRFLALLVRPPSPGAPPTLWVTSSDFSRSLSEVVVDEAVSEGEKGPPTRVAWCGNNGVVLAWERTVVLVGPFGETLKWFFPDSVHLLPEPDGTRLLTRSALSLLSLVPASSQSIFLPGSTSPSSLLYEASREFHERRSPRADEYVRAVGRGKDMRDAVGEVLDAAGREWDEAEQKRLLRAAAFGKSFLEAYDPSEFVQTTQALRVLNAVRAHKVGVPLTWEQFHSRPPSALIAHLVSLNQHLLALRISSFLGLSPAPVVTHWAAQLIAASAPGAAGPPGSDDGPRDDDAVCALIVRKLESLSPSPLPSASPSPSPAAAAVSTARAAAPAPPALSSADLALVAFRLDRTHLAKLLLDREPRAARQVALLLRMGEGEEAGSKAVASGDPELVFEVLLALRRSLPPGDLFTLLSRLPSSPLPSPSPLPSSSSSASSSRPRSRPAAAAPTDPTAQKKDGDALRLLQVLARQTGDPQWAGLVRDWWYLDDRRVEMGTERLLEAGREKDFGEKVALVRSAQKSFAEDKERAFEAKMVDDHVRLLVAQESLEQEAPGKAFVGLSVNETLRQCLLAGMDKRADKLRSEFKVPDKRYWYLKLRALISLRDWDALDAFARAKKSPIGYEPFVLELIRAGAHRQATRFVERCDARERVELYVRAGEWESAGRECVRRSERGRLVDLRSRAPNKVIAAQLEALLQEMENSGA